MFTKTITHLLMVFSASLTMGFAAQQTTVPIKTNESLAFKIDCQLPPSLFQNKQAVLNQNKDAKNNSQHIFLIHNTTSEIVLIDHPTGRAEMSAGWMSALDPNKWSAIAINKTNFALSCQKENNDKIVSLDCRKVLTVCVLQDPDLKAKQQGSFWYVENRDHETLLTGISKRLSKIAS